MRGTTSMVNGKSPSIRGSRALREGERLFEIAQHKIAPDLMGNR
jgi:hypothetical protein